jgi:hypothetical protein
VKLTTNKHVDELFHNNMNPQGMSAQTRMKAMVAARLMMGDFDSWDVFNRERETAAKIANRQIARSISAQIGRSYRNLSAETQKFISANFARCNYGDLATLCDAIPAALGLYLRLDEFETKFVPLAEHITRRFPFHAHVSISLWGLQFEFPEHHFLRDLESTIENLKEALARISQLRNSDRDPKKSQREVADLVARERFLSRSIISAAFSLLEAFLSGIFFAASQNQSVGTLSCDPDFLNYAKTKESASLKNRIEQVVNFTSQGRSTGAAEPFKSLIEYGKPFRDAIHHTTPFERKAVDAGDRLIKLYSIDGAVASRIATYCLDSILVISKWTYGSNHETVETCSRLRQEAQQILVGPL